MLFKVPSYVDFMEKFFNLSIFLFVLIFILYLYSLFKYKYYDFFLSFLIIYLIVFSSLYFYFDYKCSFKDNKLYVDIIDPVNIGNFIGIDGGLYYLNSIDGLYYWTKKDNMYQRHIITDKNIKYLEVETNKAVIYKVRYHSIFKEDEIIVHVPKGTISNNLEYININ